MYKTFSSIGKILIVALFIWAIIVIIYVFIIFLPLSPFVDDNTSLKIIEYGIYVLGIISLIISSYIEWRDIKND